MATFRGSNHQMSRQQRLDQRRPRQPDRQPFSARASAPAHGRLRARPARHGTAIADATNTEIALPPSTLPAQATASPSAVAERYERIEERYERIEERYERYTPPPTVPERRFAIRDEREEWPAAPQSTPVHTVHANAAPVDMTGDDVNITLFNTAVAASPCREIGHGWIGNDGYYRLLERGRLAAHHRRRGRSWGNLSLTTAVLVRPAYAAAQRRQLAGPHHASRITHQDRRLR